jgi:hypothetical protein
MAISGRITTSYTGKLREQGNTLDSKTRPNSGHPFSKS